jgi:hypothetical protein
MKQLSSSFKDVLVSQRCIRHFIANIIKGHNLEKLAHLNMTCAAILHSLNFVNMRWNAEGTTNLQ